MSADVIYNAIGLLGPLFFTVAFAMVSLGKWHGKQLRFHLFNLLGAVAILISISHDWNFPIFVLEVFWAAISLYGMWKARRVA